MRGSSDLAKALSRLAGRVAAQCQEIYRARGIRFDPAWSEIVAALRARQAASVTELAMLLECDSATIRDLRNALVREGLVRIRHERGDKQRQMLALSPKGRRLAEKLQALDAQIAAVLDDAIESNAPHLKTELARAVAALDGMALAERLSG